MNKKKKDIEIHTFQLNGKEYIELNQLLKFVGLVETGGHANYCISEGQVKVNEVVELRKRNKIRVGFQIEFDGHRIMVE
jgi:ribosome-associated protein